MFYTFADTRKHEFFINRIEGGRLRSQAEEKLSQVLAFADLDDCRKKYLLKYFGEEMKEEKCRSCDNCLEIKETFDASIPAKKILSAIVRTGESFGKNYVVDLLLGKRSQRVTRNGHDKLSVFGIIGDMTADGLGQIINQLANKGLLLKTEGMYPVLSLTKKGASFLLGEDKLELNKPPARRVDEGGGKDEFDRGLFERLRELRRELAEKADVPPFVIFGDRSLQEMAYYFPCSKGRLPGHQRRGRQEA
jgi:ATP-dependent DNA helicase RecQ